ncbi:hypothetical protein ILUMI_12388 [Ignelater luminosus]|uniref:Reverse transcriptase domain-containing protein n=1 Tax=Ignelater luminosus TaxID=2038154 RepID=A0A8K0CUD7_IGNLU|nr:hypothetical protein ILUMI_12388 [Ignelater luminosus]
MYTYAVLEFHKIVHKRRENETSKIKWDIIGLSEVRRAGESLPILQSENALFQKGNDGGTQKGVGSKKNDSERSRRKLQKNGRESDRKEQRFKMSKKRRETINNSSERQKWEKNRNRKKIVNEAEKYYKNLYNTQINRALTRTVTRVINVESEDIPDIIEEEILFALKIMKNNKAPGSSEILTEMIKEAPDIVTAKLQHLFNSCLEQQNIPEGWNEAIMIILFKKGGRKLLKNYRPISLLSHVALDACGVGLVLIVDVSGSLPTIGIQ